MPNWFGTGGGGGGTGVATLFASGGVTTNVIPKSNGAGLLVDSLLTDNGTTLTYTGTGGFVAPAHISSSANVASAGQVRLASTDTIKFRNNANGTDITISKSGAATSNMAADVLQLDAFGCVKVPAGTSASAPGFSLGNATGLFVPGNGSLYIIDQSGSGAYVWAVDSLGHVYQKSGALIDWGSSTVATGDTFLGRAGAANLRLGNVNSATPVAYTYTIGESARGGTDTNVAGANATIQAGNGTGTGGGGSIIFQTGAVGSTGTTANTYTTAFTINNAQQMVSGSLGTSTIVPYTFTGLTSTGMYVGQLFSSGVFNSPLIVAGGVGWGVHGASGAWAPTGNNAALGGINGRIGPITMETGAQIKWAPTGTLDTWFGRRSAANFLFGDNDAAAPVAQTITFQGSRGGTDTNTAGQVATIKASLGTGNAKPVGVIVSSGVYGASGTTQQTAVKRHITPHITAANITNNTATTVVTAALANSSAVGVQINYTVTAKDATNTQSETGTVTFSAVANSSGTQTIGTPVKSANLQAVSTGTLAVSWTAVTNGAAVDLKITSNSSLTTTTHTCTMEIINLSETNDITLV